MSETTIPEISERSSWDFEPEPQPIDAAVQEEQAVLGAMMESQDALGEVIEILQSEDFADLRHAAIYQAICDLFTQGNPADYVTVAAELERRGELIRIGGAGYLHTCQKVAYTTTNVAYNAELVASRAVLRRMVAAGTRIAQYGELAKGSSGADLVGLQANAQSQLDGVFNTRTTNVGYTDLDEMWDEAMSDLDDVQAGRVPPGLSTGFLDLDDLTGGWKPGQMIIVAARPGLGKSTLAIDFARTATVKHGRTTAVFSLEMSRKELWQRIVAAESRTRLTAMTTQGGLTTDDLDRIAAARRRIQDSAGKLIIDDNPSMSLATIRAKARTIAARHDLGLIVVDYLQLLTSGTRTENRQQEVSEFSRQLKLLAKELQVPIVALSQLNRGPENRVDKRPLLADLRESGSLEQDADIVILLNRPDAYDRDDPRGGEADLIIAKHRGGPTNTVAVAHQLHFSRFADLARA